MISAEWLLLLLPCLLAGIKHAEAYAEYKRKIKES